MNKPDPIHSEDIREQLEDYFYQALEVELLLRLFPDDEDTICQIVDVLVETAEVAKDNIASCKLLEKFNFKIKKESSYKKYHMNIEFKSYIFEYHITKPH